MKRGIWLGSITVWWDIKGIYSPVNGLDSKMRPLVSFAGCMWLYTHMKYSIGRGDQGTRAHFRSTRRGGVPVLKPAEEVQVLFAGQLFLEWRRRLAEWSLRPLVWVPCFKRRHPQNSRLSTVGIIPILILLRCMFPSKSVLHRFCSSSPNWTKSKCYFFWPKNMGLFSPSLRMWHPKCADSRGDLAASPVPSGDFPPNLPWQRKLMQGVVPAHDVCAFIPHTNYVM